MCVKACPQNLIKVGGGYVYIDVSGCSACMSCVEACSSGAIVKAGRDAQPMTATAGTARAKPAASQTPKVVVGSRAEAKALRESARKSAAKPPAKPSMRSVSAKSKTAVSPQISIFSATEALAVAAMLLVLLIAKDAVLASRFVEVMPEQGRLGTNIGVLAVFYAVQVSVLVSLVRRRGESVSSAFRLAPGSDIGGWAVAAGLVALLAVGTRAASTAWGALSQSVGFNPPGSGTLTGLFGAGSLGLFMAVLMAVIVGPLTEELAFRGVIAPAIHSRFGKWPAIIASAALFALYHVTPWLWAPMFVFGVALGWLALSRQSLWPAIALHAIYNGVVVAAAFWLAK